MEPYVVVGKPNEIVYKIASLRRCQREWINERRSINFSALAQEAVWQVIEKNDPEYYEKNKKYRITPEKFDTTFNIFS